MTPTTPNMLIMYFPVMIWITLFCLINWIIQLNTESFYIPYLGTIVADSDMVFPPIKEQTQCR